MYKRFFIGVIVLISTIGIYSFVYLTDDPFPKIRRQLEKWTLEQPVEKVYLHVDKPYYAAGEDIWFKAYVVSGGLHRLSTLSGILNVELIDEQDSIKQSVKLPIDSGVAHGDFALPDTLHQGNYRIRAYTNYMRNAGSEYFFAQQIPIINTVNDNKNTAQTPAVNNGTGKIDVQFFPESGYLVNGIMSKVAFKAIAPNGLGIAIKGSVTNSKGRQVAAFASIHLGMGIFELMPETGETYQAKIIIGDGSAITIPLPKAADKGAVLSIDDNDNNDLLVKIARSKPLSSNQFGTQLTLIAQSGGKIYYTAKTKARIVVSSLIIPKNKFPSGIVQFTLFSEEGESLNERLVFVQNNDQLNLKLTADRQIYAPRQRVKLMLTARNSDNQPAAGNFSVSVIDETMTPADENMQNNILANLLLTSDLRGYVEQAGWYFNNTDEKTREALDVLMLTQGYRRFKWKEILNNVYPAKQYLPENSLQVSGTVLTTSGKPVIAARVKLFDLDSIEFTRDAVTDEHGRFAFKNLTFADSVRFIVQARTSKNKKDVNIKMDNLLPANTSSAKNWRTFQTDLSNPLAVYAQSSKQLYLAQRRYGLGNHVISLQEVVIREKKQAVRNSSNLNGPGNADQIILGKDLQLLGCINISDCLQGILVGVNFRNGVAFSTRDFRPMQLIVDGMYVENRYLNTINYNDIQAIEVLRNIGLTSIYGGRGGSGVLLVTTKRGDEDDEPEPIYGRGITTYYPKGYYKAREFYSPLYDRSGTNKQLADLRTTIYWNPNLLTGKDGHTFFEYFNAGSKGTYRVVIEGLDNEGHLGRQVYRYQVQ